MKKRNLFWILSPIGILWFGFIVSLGIQLTQNKNIEIAYLNLLNYLYFVYIILSFVALFIMSKDYFRKPSRLKIVNYALFLLIMVISLFPQNFFILMFLSYSIFIFWQPILIVILIAVFIYQEIKIAKFQSVQ